MSERDEVLAGLLDGANHATCESCVSVMKRAYRLFVDMPMYRRADAAERLAEAAADAREVARGEAVLLRERVVRLEAQVADAQRAAVFRAQVEAAAKLVVTGDGPDRLVVDARALLPEGDTGPWHFRLYEVAGSPGEWAHAESGTSGPLSSVLRGIAHSYIDRDALAAEDYSAPEDHAFIGQPGDVCEVCRYAREAAWHYEAPQPRVLWRGETTARSGGSVVSKVNHFLQVRPGTRVVVIEDTEPLVAEVTHACPPDDIGAMPCCGRTPLEVPRTDGITLDPALVTCRPVHGDTEHPS